MSAAEDLGTLRAVHAEYWQRAVDQCFLNKKAQYIIQAILNILDVAGDLENPELLDKAAIDAVRARAGRLSGLSISLYKSVFYGPFVWVRMALNSQKRRFSARAESSRWRQRQMTRREAGALRQCCGMFAAASAQIKPPHPSLLRLSLLVWTNLVPSPTPTRVAAVPQLQDFRTRRRPEAP